MIVATPAMLRLRVPKQLSVEATRAVYTDALGQLIESRRAIRTLPEPGRSYAIFHRNYALERLQDLYLLYTRMVDGRSRLSDTNASTNKQDSSPPNAFSELLIETLSLGHALKVDLESFYQFGGLLLDQWSLMIAHLEVQPDAEGASFHRVVGMMDDPRERAGRVIRALGSEVVSDARWLSFQFRAYRNKFIVHATRPWQRTTVADLVGDDFALFTPSPPGWEDDKAIATEILALLPLAPDWLRNSDETYWERARPGRLLERIVENIGSASRQFDRERVVQIVARAGLTTPSFRVLAGTLFTFASAATQAATAALVDGANEGSSPDPQA